jgi:uncharacterized RDD family membrane protein YckC
MAPNPGAGPQYAGFLRRFVAHLVDDLIVQCCLGFLLFGLLHAPTHGHGLAGYGLFQLFVSWLYYASMESSGHQATLGKMLLGMKVTMTNGDRLTFGEASLRFFGKILSSITIIGYLLPIFTKRKQALHDFVADTVVVKE